jgi:hypothetical protein
MAALKAQGSLVDYLLATGGRSRKKTARTPDAPDIEIPIRDSRHRPGAWPAGTRTDGPTCDPGCPCALIKPEES